MPDNLSILLNGPDSALPDRESVERDWGITTAWPVFGPVIRILFVIDGRITPGYGEQEFGLGYVLDTLRNTFAWWVRLSIAVANRGGAQGFRFTDPSFDLNGFDQVWFFGDNPGPIANNSSVGDNVIDDAKYAPLDDDELLILARWMERGGGVFATGDHAMLGASMCHRIPRVRSMRKWTRAQGVPPFSSAGRHETLQPSTGDELAWEGDAVPQRISPVFRAAGRFAAFQRTVHPLLCGRDGVIDRFPDHMHEGSVVEGDAVDLQSSLDIPDFEGLEYPLVEPQVATLILDGAGAPALGIRPRPEVIAYGWTTNTDNQPRRFPLLSVYDGEPAGVGRVVVDSTWHHWFSMNLVGFREGILPPTLDPVYRGLQDYYRNVAFWLATPQQRAAMLVWATWGVLVGKHPGAMDRVMGVWELGRRAVDAIGRTAPQCLVSEFVDAFLLDLPIVMQSREERTEERPQVAPIRALANQAVVGGIAHELLEDAHEVVLAGIHGQAPHIDADRLLAKAAEGAATGLVALREELRSGAALLSTVSDYLAEPPKRSD